MLVAIAFGICCFFLAQPKLEGLIIVSGHWTYDSMTGQRQGCNFGGSGCGIVVDFSIAD